jgi:type VI protein secretion system component Hcp
MKANSLKALACGALVTASLAAEASPYYLTIAGIEGVVTTPNPKLKPAIALQDFQWGVEFVFPESDNKGVLVGTDFSWTQSLNISVPAIIASLGTEISSAELVGFDGLSTLEYFSMKFSGVRITSFQMSGSSDGPPEVSGVFEYDTLAISVWAKKPDGSRGEEKRGSFSAKGFEGSTKVFAQFADFSQPVLDDSSVVPVPAALPLLVSGLGCLAWAGRRRARSTAGAV